MNLFNLTTEFNNALNIIQLKEDEYLDQETGEVLTSEQFEKILNDLDMDRNEKIKNCCLYLKDLEGDLDKITKESKRISEAKARQSKKIDGFEQYIKNSMTVGEKLDFTTFKVSLVKGVESVVIDKENQKIDKKYVVKKDPVYDKRLLKKDLKDGVVIEGAVLKRINQSLRFK